MPATRLIAINGSGGAFVDILATSACSQFQIQEDDAATRQGLQVKTLLDKCASLNSYATTAQPIDVPNPHKYGINGPLLGLPAQGTSGAFNYRAADKLASVRSLSATATTIRFIEHE